MSIGGIIAVIFLYVCTYLFVAGSIFANFIEHALLVACCIVITKSDVETFEIPDWASLGVAVIGALAALSIDLETLAIHLFSGVVILAILWWAGGLMFRYWGREGLGIGDAKLIAAGTVLLGPLMLPMLILVASLGGITAVLVSRAIGKAKQNPTVPFGPFIAYALFVLNLIATVGA